MTIEIARREPRKQHPRSVLARKRNGLLGRIYYCCGGLSNTLDCIVRELRVQSQFSEVRKLTAAVRQLQQRHHTELRELANWIEQFYEDYYNITTPKLKENIHESK